MDVKQDFQSAKFYFIESSVDRPLTVRNLEERKYSDRCRFVIVVCLYTLSASLLFHYALDPQMKR